MNCSDSTITTSPSQKLSLEPLQSTELTFNVYASYFHGSSYICNITLTDDIGTILDYDEIKFNTSTLKVISIKNSNSYIVLISN